jgi:hypothetical protein
MSTRAGNARGADGKKKTTGERREMDGAQVVDVEGRKLGKFLLSITAAEMKLIHNSVDEFLEKHKKKKGLLRLFREFQNLNCR